VTCPPGDVCDPDTGQCVPKVSLPAPAVARDLLLDPVSALAIDASGNAYLASQISSPVPVSFDGHPVASTGDEDVFLARYNPGGTADWAVSIGDAAGNPQRSAGVAVTQNGTLAVIGNFSGSISIGSSNINSASQIDFLAGLKAADGAGRWARQFNDGANGVLLSVGASPASASNRIAVCGKASAAATDLVPGATFGGLTDLVIGVFDSAGNRLWSAQIGGPGNEECDAVAVDDAGDVYAAGKFDGPSLTFSPLAPLTGPGSTSRKFLWIAKLSAATGAALAAVAYSGATGQVTPLALSPDASGTLTVAGSFTGSLLFAGTTLTGAGGQDVFVARVDPATSLAPLWAARMGGTGPDVVTGMGTTSTGDVLVAGSFQRTTTGVAALTASGTSTDLFLLELDGATGALRFGAPTAADKLGDPVFYGDEALQTADALAVNRWGTGSAQDHFAFSGTLNGTADFPAPAGRVTASGVTDVLLVVGGVQ